MAPPPPEEIATLAPSNYLQLTLLFQEAVSGGVHTLSPGAHVRAEGESSAEQARADGGRSAVLLVGSGAEVLAWVLNEDADKKTGLQKLYPRQRDVGLHKHRVSDAGPAAGH